VRQGPVESPAGIHHPARRPMDGREVELGGLLKPTVELFGNALRKHTFAERHHMPYVAASVDIATDADSVWALIGPFGLLAEWLPGFSRVELEDGGRVRRLHADDGSVFVERIVTVDDEGRSCSYTIVEAPLGVGRNLKTKRIRSLGDGSSARVDWTAAYTSTSADQDVRAIMQSLFDDGLKALAGKF